MPLLPGQTKHFLDVGGLDVPVCLLPQTLAHAIGYDSGIYCRLLLAPSHRTDATIIIIIPNQQASARPCEFCWQLAENPAAVRSFQSVLGSSRGIGIKIFLLIAFLVVA